MKKRILVGTVFLVLLLGIGVLSEATVYYCSQWNCAPGYLCNSDRDPVWIGTCIFKCSVAGGWVVHLCGLPGSK